MSKSYDNMRIPGFNCAPDIVFTEPKCTVKHITVWDRYLERRTLYGLDRLGNSWRWTKTQITNRETGEVYNVPIQPYDYKTA